jgi:hypothetical protein
MVRRSVESQTVYNRVVIHFARNKRVDNEKKTKKATAGAELWLMQEESGEGGESGEIVETLAPTGERASERVDKVGERVLGGVLGLG